MNSKTDVAEFCGLTQEKPLNCSQREKEENYEHRSDSRYANKNQKR